MTASRFLLTVFSALVFGASFGYWYAQHRGGC